MTPAVHCSPDRFPTYPLPWHVCFRSLVGIANTSVDTAADDLAMKVDAAGAGAAITTAGSVHLLCGGTFVFGESGVVMRANVCSLGLPVVVLLLQCIESVLVRMCECGSSLQALHSSPWAITIVAWLPAPVVLSVVT
jgi:hypothetical protein